VVNIQDSKLSGVEETLSTNADAPPLTKRYYGRIVNV
jgi:hypothetical protein